jgi:hypothetical protein
MQKRYSGPTVGRHICECLFDSGYFLPGADRQPAANKHYYQ